MAHLFPRKVQRFSAKIGKPFDMLGFKIGQLGGVAKTRRIEKVKHEEYLVRKSKIDEERGLLSGKKIVK